MIFFRHGSNFFIAVLLGALVLSLLPHLALLHHWHFVVAGIALFIVVEYVMHRFVLHAAPVANPTVARLQKRLHYDHHIDPNRLDLLFLPMWFAVPSICTYGALYYFLSHSLLVMRLLLAGNMIGLLYYEWVHYVAHVPITPRTAWGRYMKKYHLWHHFKNEHYWFGVTSPLIDHVFGTYGAQSDISKSGTTRNLYSN
jgi:hypothetical protein